MIRRLASGALLLALGCGHSTPCCDAITGSEGPFDAVAPTRLTFALGANLWPAFSWDDHTVSYRYRRGTADRDLCAGLLPAIGGQRVGDACAWELTDAQRADVFMSLTPLEGGTVAFTRHSSALGASAPQSGGLYVGQLNAIRDARLVLPLLSTPAGAGGRYDFLMTPVRTGPTQLLALAGQFVIGATVQHGPVDTLYQGLEIVRIDLGGPTAVVTPLVGAAGAVAWAADLDAGWLYFHRPTYAPPTATTIYQVLADTVFRVRITGGTPEPLWGRPTTVPFAGLTNSAIDGLAAGGGRVFISWHHDRPTPEPPEPPTGYEARSALAEITPGGTLREFALLSAPTTAQRLWRRLALSSDGNRLVAERREGASTDLYLFDRP